MGQQSININDRKSILKNTEKNLLVFSDDKYMKDHFLIGDGVDKDVLYHNLLIQYALSTPNCEVIDWVWYKLNGKMDNTKICTWELKPLTIQENCEKISACLTECSSYTN